MSNQPVLIVTAGHIDHGKSALVKALTGTDPDRLEEEKRRGMTIDLGFAFLTDNIAFVDVPGHERFVKNMVSGIAPVAAVLLVIAADDGVMPQTREHLAILHLLGLQSGLIVINKVDLVEEEWLQLVIADVRQLVQGTFLENAPLFKTSTVTGEGIEELKTYLTTLSMRQTYSQTSSIFRLPVDRIFSAKGYGTVVTGSVISGRVRIGEEIEIVPAGKKCHIRRLESHNQVCESVTVGQRAAINLVGVERQEIKRGDFLATPCAFIPTTLLTAQLSLLEESPELEYNDLARVHLGTGEFMARVRLIGKNSLRRGESGIAQFIFSEKVAAAFRERFIVRSFSPQYTIGGGLVLEVNPKPLRKKDQVYAEELQSLVSEPLSSWLVFYLKHKTEMLCAAQELAVNFTCDLTELEANLAQLIKSQEVSRINESYILTEHLQATRAKILATITQFHRENPLTPAIEKANLLATLKIDTRLGSFLLDDLIRSKLLKTVDEGYALPNFEPVLNDRQQELLNVIEMTVAQAGLMPPTIEELAAQYQLSQAELRALLNLLVLNGKITILDKVFPFHQQALSAARNTIVEFLRKNGSGTVSALKSCMNISRKWTLPILNYFDQQGVTIRDGELRRLREDAHV